MLFVETYALVLLFLLTGRATANESSQYILDSEHTIVSLPVSGFTDCIEDRRVYCERPIYA